MRVFLTHSSSTAYAFFVFGQRVSTAVLTEDAFGDGKVTFNNFCYQRESVSVPGQLDTYDDIQYFCSRRHERLIGESIDGFKEIPISSVAHEVKVEILKDFRVRITGCNFHSTEYILECGKSVNVRRRVFDSSQFINVQNQLYRFLRNAHELGKLVGQAVRRSFDDEVDGLEKINELVDEIGSFAPEINKKISDLDIGLKLASCGHLELADELCRVADSGGYMVDTACRTCYEDSDVVVYCVDDGCRHWRDDVYYWESDDEYHLSEEEEEESYDEPSRSDPDQRLEYDCDVMQFLSKDSSFKSSCHGDFHMGIELETAARDYDVSISDKVYTVRRELGEEYLVCKYDGSVGDKSMEWVTRPTSLKVHIEKLGGWKSTDGLVAWNNRSCGMHVHIDSKAFTALTLGKMIQFYNSPRNDSFIRAIAGRHPRHDSQAAEYAALDSTTVVYSPNAALKGKDSSRYRMINCENLSHAESSRLGMKERWGDSNTVEIRIFRASLKKERLLAQIEFAHAAVMFCRVTSYRNLDQDHFLKWLRNASGMYPNLCKWFNVNNRHGNTATKTDSLANGSSTNQSELFAQAA